MSKMLILAVAFSIVSCSQPLWSLPVDAQGLVNQPMPFKISQPYTSGNLSVFLIRGSDKVKTDNAMTLQEAMAQDKVKVRETGNVNNLEIENLSDRMVFIQSGDIVKGGRQDRTMQYDMILPPHSGMVPLPAFCVEHGRWSGRGAEASDRFAKSENALVGKQLKLAARKAGDQQQVWNKVAEGAGRIYHQVAAALPSPAASEQQMSAQNASGSMQLALENKQVSAAVDDQMKKLVHIVDGDKSVIGFAFAINGKLNSADVYGSNGLFLKMWPKELKSAVTEALGQKNEKPKPGRVITADVEKALERSDKAKVSRQQQSNTRTQLLDREDTDSVVFETVDKKTGALVHKSYFAK